MSTIATLAVKVIADTASYHKDMDGAAKKAQQIGGTMQKVGGVMSAAVTGPLVGIGLAAINMASDVGESTSKVQQLFGDASNAVTSWSDTTAESMGIAKADALSMSGELGNLLIAQGLAGDSAADMSMDMVQLAADMASFNNASPEETFAAIQAGAIGSSEPLRKYGVVINEASVQQTALKMTGKKTTAELTEQDKTLARLKLITEQTTQAHGDFKKTSDGLANQQRITTATIKDQAAALGNELLPIGITVIGWVRSAITWFGSLSETQKKAIIVIGLVVAAIGPLIGIIGTMISVISAAIPVIVAIAGVLSVPLILIIGAVIAIVALLAAAWKNDWGGIQEKTRTVIGWMKTNLDNLIGFIKNLWTKGSEYVSNLRGAIDSAFAGIKDAIRWVIDKINNLIAAFSRIHVPKILTGHSPSPFETSLRGIGDAMDELSRKSLRMNANLKSGGNQYNYNITANYKNMQSEASIKDTFRMMELVR